MLGGKKKCRQAEGCNTKHALYFVTGSLAVHTRWLTATCAGGHHGDTLTSAGGHQGDRPRRWHPRGDRGHVRPQPLLRQGRHPSGGLQGGLRQVGRIRLQPSPSPYPGSTLLLLLLLLLPITPCPLKARRRLGGGSLCDGPGEELPLPS